MAIYKAQNYDANAPLTVQHAGTLVVHRAVVKFPSETTLISGDVLLLSTLPQGYVLDGVKIDIDSPAQGVFINVGVLNDDETLVEHLAIENGDLSSIGFIDINSVNALRQGRFDANKTLGATVGVAGAVIAGTEIGFTFTYRNAQPGE